MLMIMFEKFGKMCPQILKNIKVDVFLKVGTCRGFSPGNGYVILYMLLIQGSQTYCFQSFIAKLI